MSDQTNDQIPDQPEQKEPTSEEEAKWLYNNLRQQGSTTQGAALAAMASIGLIHMKLIDKGIITKEEVAQMVEEGKQLQSLMLDAYVGKMLSNDQWVADLGIKQEPRELVMARCDESIAAINQALGLDNESG